MRLIILAFSCGVHPPGNKSSDHDAYMVMGGRVSCLTWLQDQFLVPVVSPGTVRC